MIHYPKNLKKQLHNLPLRRKLAGMIMLSCFIPMLLVILYSYVQTRSHIISQFKHNMHNTISQVNNNISRKIDSLRQISALLYTDTLLEGYLRQDYQKAREFVTAYQYINSSFYGILASNADIDSITVYIDNPTLPDDSFFIKYLNDPLHTPDRIRSLDYSAGGVTIQSYSQAGVRYISFNAVLDRATTNFPYGFLELAVRESVFYNLYAQETSDKDIYITDSNGTILSANQKDEIGKKLEESLGLSPTALKGNEITIPVHGIPSIIADAGTPGGLHCFAVIPSALVLQATAETSAQMIALASLSLLFALYLINRVSGYFSRRFQLLGERIARLEQGEFKNDDIGEELMGTDEIGQLYRTFTKMSGRLNDLIDELYKKEITKKEAELRLLQSQINPHFLYNTLAAISSLAIHHDDRETAELSTHLSQFYKSSLHKGQWYISVKKELDITRHYIAIQHKRFPNRFQDVWKVDEQALPHTTLKLMLQPFVENAITHALPEDLTPVTIKLHCHLRENHICYLIEDDGAGMEESVLAALNDENSGIGYGIGNTRDRIRLAYGSDYHFRIHSRLGQGTRVEISLPWSDN